MLNKEPGLLLEHIAQELSAPDVVFPTCFDVTIRVHTLLKDPDLALDKLAEILSTEPLMSAKLIHLANSVAMRGAGQEVTELKAAILRVGLEVVRTVSYTVAVEQLVRSKQMARYQGLSHKIWEHSLLVAAIARQLARQSNMSTDKAFFLGMVHDIGAFYLLFRCAADQVLASDEAELTELLYEWHDGIGHALLTALGQSEDITEAVQEHESLSEITTLHRWPEILATADWLAQRTADWAPTAQRNRQHLEIPERLLNEDAQAEVLQNALKEVGELHAALF